MRRPEWLRGTGFKLAGLTAGVVLVVLAAVALVVSLTVRGALFEQVRVRAERETAELVAASRRGPEALAEALRRRTAARVISRFSYLLTAPDGTAIAGDGVRIDASPGWHELRGDGGKARGAEAGVVVLNTRLPDGRVLSVASDVEWIDRVLEALRDQFAAALGGGLVLAAGAGALVSRFVLGRIGRINATAEAIIAGDLARRVPASGAGDEFDRLAATLNRMLERIGSLVDSLRQVSSDVAHDLRTPLSRLRQGLEAARERSGSVEGYRQAVERAIAEADGLLDTFGALLRIAQIEGGRATASFREVDLTELLRTVESAYGAAAEDEGRRLVSEIGDGLRVRGDRDLLAQLFANLVENALRHTPPGTTIRLGASSGARGVTAFVADDGPGVPAGERGAVLRRFHRLERSRTTPGNGLGLSLVAAVADLHGAELRLEDAGPGLRVVIAFPVGAGA